ncbi:hypothetical protein FIV00_03905 [Labrenzia sp. THAF82]|nr:hypothetical protein FIV00_03905 [Labrenzia sp. THAF82]
MEMSTSMPNVNAALLQDFLQIPIGNRIAHIKEDCEKNDILREMVSFETDQRCAPGEI